MKTRILQIHPLGWNIIFGTLISRIATSMTIPFLSIYLIQIKGVSPTIVGLIIATSSLVGVFTSFFGGYISDIIDKRKTMIISSVLWSVVFFAFFRANSVIAFFILNSLNGLCYSIFEPASKALLSDITKEENRLQIFNFRYTAINLGVVIGPILGLYLGSGETSYPFLITSIIYLLYGISLSFQHSISITSSINVHIEEEKNTLKKVFLVIRKDKKFLMILLGVIFSISGYAHLNSTFPQYLSLRMKEGAGYYSIILSLNAITALLIQYPVINVMKKFSPINSIIGGNFLISVSLIFMSLSSNLFQFIITIIIFTIGEVLIFSMLDILTDQIATSKLKSTYFGTMGLSRLGNVIAPSLGGLLLSFFSIENSIYTFSILSFITILGVPLLIVATKKQKHKIP
ncbi:MULTISPECIES: MFS transporter [unclassified Rummeliibacillus]|uniref:MDR family MFS transporter n=1 Tax=unclassified Rummeliibacillus TaxID=2622809 RepID=UPI000E6622DA|nr:MULTISPECIES: MFS transporter [unclassified Rummeliibacillus]RIJ63326.1 MFS transporter [Rummeliibacillus sp. POC4]RPJ96120.1 MFS transporter [Rummeliibacillus sp. TYF005]